MESIAKAKFQRISYQKISQMLNEIRGKNITMAEYIAKAASKGASTLVIKTMNSAAANLSVKLGKKLNPDEVWIKSAYAGMGPMKHLRRVQPGPQGRAMPFKRKMSHLTITVSDERKKK